MLPHDDWSWRDPDGPWNVKLRRAARHIADLTREVEAFRETAPCILVPEATDTPGRYAYRMRQRPIPVEFSAIVGDVLNNLRAALESVAYEIARQGQGGRLQPEQESAPAFPIFDKPAKFEEFFDNRHWKLLYGQQARAAMRAVQPFAIAELVKQSGADLGRSYEEEAKYSPLFRLNALWNIDKHRRLNLMLWRLKFVYWPEAAADPERHFVPTNAAHEDGAILFHMDGDDAGDAIGVNYEFNLALADDPAFIDNPMADDDVLDLLTSWHQHIAGYVVPLVFTTAVSTP